MSDFRKPRSDYPIYPSTGYFQKRAKAFKVPKGRRGRKPKGKRVGSFVPYQDPNFRIIKAQDEARKARELAVEQAKEEIEFKKAQRKELEKQEKERKEREKTRVAERKEDKKQLQLESDRRETRLLKDREEIVGQLTKLYEQSERRAGENIKIFQSAFKAIEDRRPINFEDIKAQEQTDLTGDQRRDRRDRSPSAELEVEEVFSRAQRKQTAAEISGEGRFLRGETNKPKRFGQFATEEELAAAGAIEGQTPATQRGHRKREVGGATGSEETQRRGKGAGGKVPKVFVKDDTGGKDIKDVKIIKKTTTTFQDTPEAFEQEGREGISDVKITKKTTFYPTAEN